MPRKRCLMGLGIRRLRGRFRHGVSGAGWVRSASDGHMSREVTSWRRRAWRSSLLPCSQLLLLLFWDFSREWGSRRSGLGRARITDGMGLPCQGTAASDGKPTSRSDGVLHEPSRVPLLRGEVAVSDGWTDGRTDTGSMRGIER